MKWAGHVRAVRMDRGELHTKF